MSRLPADPVGRLAKLEAVRAGVKRGTVVNAAELEKVLGITWRFLKQMIDADAAFPVKTRGDMGVPWEFHLLKVVDHLIKQARTAQADRERRFAEVSRFAGLGANPGVSSPGDRASDGSGTAARDMLEQARALDALLSLQTKVRQERERQNQLLDRVKVQEFLWRWLSTLQSEVLAIRQRLDKAGTLSLEMRQALDDELASILVSMRDALQRGIETQDAARR